MTGRIGLWLGSAAVFCLPTIGWADYNTGEACSTAGAFHTKNDSDAATHLICDGSEWVTSVVFDKDGPVGIGTASPDTELEVAGDISAEQYCDEDGANCFSAAIVNGVISPPGNSSEVIFNDTGAWSSSSTFKYESSASNSKLILGAYSGGNQSAYLDLQGYSAPTLRFFSHNGWTTWTLTAGVNSSLLFSSKGSSQNGGNGAVFHYKKNTDGLLTENYIGLLNFGEINLPGSGIYAINQSPSRLHDIAIRFRQGTHDSTYLDRFRFLRDGTLTAETGIGIGNAVFPSAYLRSPASGAVAIYEPDNTTLATLVAGGISSEQYCDEDGEDCFSAASVGSVAAAGPDRAIQFNTSSALAGNGKFLFTSAGSVELTTGSATTIGMRIKGVASQSGNLFEFQSAGSTTPLARVTKDGGFSNNQGFTNSEAFGDGATLTGQNSVVIGKGASGGGSSNGGHSVIIGAGATGTLARAVVIGSGASGSDNAVVIGRSATGLTAQSISIGASANGDLAIGWNATSLSEGVAIGSSSSTTGVDAVAVGEDATATRNSVAVGHSATANGSGDRGSVAIGRSASNATFYATAIGRGAVNTAHYQFVGGGSDATDSKRTDIYFGNGVVNAAPVTTTYHGSGGSGTDIAGADLALAGGRATGNAIGGSILFQTSDAGASGTTLRSLSTKMTLTATGNLGIGTTSPTAKLHVDGDIHYTGAVADVSDRRLKENITPLADQLVKITALQPVSFVMKGDSTTEMGLIAQDVGPLFPELVKTNPDGMMTLNYVGLIGPMIAAIQEQQSQIEELRAENVDLARRLDDIEARLQSVGE